MNKNAPREWKRYSDVLKAKRDNLDVGEFWILSDFYTVTICAQRLGQSPTEKITLPSNVFNRMVDWYMTGEERPKRASGAKGKKS